MSLACDHCGFDLSMRMDLLASAIKADYPDGDYPKDLVLEGICGSCGGSFEYSGAFFSYYMTTKVTEGIISSDTDKYAIVSFDVSEEEHEEFKKLTKLDDKKKLDEFIRKILLKSDTDTGD